MPLHVDYMELSWHALVCSVGEECTQEVADLLDICMRTNVEERPSAKELVAVLQVSHTYLLFVPLWATMASVQALPICTLVSLLYA